jgi:hypothetical protein
MKTYVHFVNSRCILVKMRCLRQQLLTKVNTHFMLSTFFPPSIIM